MQHNKLTLPPNSANHPQDMAKSPYRYFEHTPERQASLIELVNAGGEKETFSQFTPLAHGKHGDVRTVVSAQSGSTFAVKRMTINPGYLDRPNQEELSDYIEFVNHEMQFLSAAYPGCGPYLVKHFINADGDYDYRILMPYFPGKQFNQFVAEEIKTPAEFALLILKITEEIIRIHKLGFYHGDLHPGNILCRKNGKQEFGIDSFDVHFVDFSLADKISDPKICSRPVGSFIIDDVYDVSWLLDDINTGVKALCQSGIGQQITLMFDFPVLHHIYELKKQLHEKKTEILVILRDKLRSQLAVVEQARIDARKENASQLLSLHKFSKFTHKPVIAKNGIDNIEMQWKRETIRV